MSIDWHIWLEHFNLSNICFPRFFIFSELDDYEVFHPPPVDSTGTDPIVNLIHLVTAGGGGAAFYPLPTSTASLHATSVNSVTFFLTQSQEQHEWSNWYIQQTFEELEIYLNSFQHAFQHFLAFQSMEQFVFDFWLPPLLVRILKESAAAMTELHTTVVANLLAK